MIIIADIRHTSAIFAQRDKTFVMLHLKVMQLVALLFTNIASLGLFTAISQYIQKGDFLHSIDIYFNLQTQLIWSEKLNSVVIWFSKIVGPKALIAATVIIATYLIYRHRFSLAGVTVVSVPIVVLSTKFLKSTIGRERPEEMLVVESGFSFPSLHATIAAFVATMLSYWIIHTKRFSFWQRVSLTTFVIIIALLIGGSRIYLGVHWFSDVIAGFLVGLFWSTFFLIADIAAMGEYLHFPHHKEMAEEET